jgi:hypothetical protein
MDAAAGHDRSLIRPAKRGHKKPVQLDQTTIELARAVTAPAVRDVLAPVIAQLEHALSVAPGQPQAWNALPLDRLMAVLPEEIRSCWVFVLRSGATFGAERHPNSHQRSIALAGSADFQLFDEGQWRTWPVRAGGVDAAISIAPMVWHRIQIGSDNFVSASFHTCPAEQLIEETPIGNDLSVTKQRAYHA